MGFPRIVVAVSLLASFAACAPDTGVESTGEEEASTNEERALSADTVYRVLGQDYRKCAFPMCGGFFVKAVNKDKTTCFDGTKAAQCYVADLDLSSLELPEAQTAEVRSAAIAGDVLLSGELTELQGGIAKLKAYKGFESRTEAEPTGTYYNVASSGIVCITTPCPSLKTLKLNSTTEKNITDVDFSALGLTEEETSAAMTTVFEKGLVMSGVIKTKNQSKKLVVSQIFDTVEPALQLCLTEDACGESEYCDMTECLSGCAPGQICPAVCYGACKAGDPPAPEGGSCVDACGGPSADGSCYCDDACTDYGDCCDDYVVSCQ